jgi:hypothetical protein
VTGRPARPAGRPVRCRAAAAGRQHLTDHLHRAGLACPGSYLTADPAPDGAPAGWPACVGGGGRRAEPVRASAATRPPRSSPPLTSPGLGKGRP